MTDILMFHRVLPKTEINDNDAYYLRGTLISQERFEQVIRKYLQLGFLFKTISNLDNNSKTNQVALTFDDGYIDNYLYVKPILEKHNVKATFYPIIGYCKEQTIAPLDYYYSYINDYIDLEEKEDWILGGQKKAFLALSINQQKEFINELFQNIPLASKIAYMTTKQLQELQKMGHEIGGHSYYHDIYTKLDKTEIKNDILKTKKALFEIGVGVNSYAYTDGQYNSATIEILKKEQINYACAIRSKGIAKNTNYELERKFVTENEII